MIKLLITLSLALPFVAFAASTTVRNSDGSWSRIEDHGNGTATVKHSDGSWSKVETHQGGGATVKHSDGSWSKY